MLIAIVIGMIVRNTIGVSARFASGIRYAVISVMPLGIVLKGPGSTSST